MRWIKRLLLALVLVPLCLLALAYGALQTQATKDKLAILIESQASKNGQSLRLDSLQGHLPWHVSFKQIGVSDNDGEWLNIHNATLKWDIWQALQGDVTIETLTSSHIHVLRFPTPQATQKASAKPAIPILPPIRLAQLALPKITLPMNEGTASIAISASGAIAHGRLEDATINATIADIGAINPALTGVLDTSFTAHGALDALQLGLLARSDNITANGKSLQEIQLRYDGTTNLHQWVEQGWAHTDIAMNISAIFDQQSFTAEAEGELGEKQHINLPALSISTPYGMMKGRATYDIAAQHIDTQLTTKNTALEPFAKPVSGSLDATFSAKGSISDLPITLKASARELANLPDAASRWLEDHATLALNARITPTLITLHDATLTSGTLQIDAKGTVPLAAQKQTATLSLSARHKELAPIDIDATLLRDNHHIALSDITLSTIGIQAIGDMRYDMGAQLAKGTLKLNGSDIAPLADWAGLPHSKGAVHGTVHLDHPDNTQRVKADINVAKLRIPSQQLAAKHINITLNAANIYAPHTLFFHGDAKHITTEKLQLHQATLDAQNADNLKDTLSFKTSLKGLLDGHPLTLQSSGLWQQHQQGSKATLSALSGAIDRLPYQLKNPASLTVSPRAWTLSPIALTLDKGSIHARGSQTPKGIIAMDATLTQIPLKPFLKHAPPSLPSHANATLAVSGSAKQPKVMLLADSSMTLPNDEVAAITLTAAWDNMQRNPRIDSALTIASSTPLIDGNVAVPARLSLEPFTFTLSSTAPLQGHANASLELDRLRTILKPYGHNLAGSLRSDMQIAGTLAQPELTGTIDVANGSYDHNVYGVCLRDITAQASIANDIISLTTLQAKGDKARGTLSGKGVVDMGQSTIDASLDMDSLKLLCHSGMEGKLSGDLALNGTLDAMDARGALEINSAAITIPSIGGVDSIPSIPVAYQEELATIKRNKKNKRINLGIDVSLPNRVFVRGRGLDAEFKGKMRLAGTASTPRIDGRLTTDKGRMDVLGSTLQISKGSLYFINQNPTKPYLNLAATSRADGININVGLVGSVKNPTLSLSSTPARPQDEILALLLFGRPIETITPIQALQLAQATATLAGKSGGTSVLGLARESLGIDALSVNQNNNGDVTVGAGKYITNKVFVGVEQGLTPESRSFTTEIELTPNIKAETKTDSQGEPSVGLEWRYDY